MRLSDHHWNSALVASVIAISAASGCGTRSLPGATSPAPTRAAGPDQAAPEAHGTKPATPPTTDLGPPGEDEVTTPATTPPPPVSEPAKPHPFASLTDQQLESMLKSDAAALGSLSLGRTNAGALFNAVAMPKGPRWKIVNPAQTWGTAETIAALTRCIDRVNETFPGTPPVHIGDISERNGGHIRPHLSHQSGRDVDVGYYYKADAKWYRYANKDNLDLPRTWAFVKAMVTETDVQRIFIDRRIQKLLRDYAEAAGEDPTWLDQVFGGPRAKKRALILHERGHATHIHVRFFNPVAQESGRRLYRLLVAHGKISPPTYYIQHKVRRRDTLSGLAKKYSTTVKAIKKANRLRSSMIRTGRKYKIPRRGGVAAAPRRIVIPPRRLPPARHAGAASPGLGSVPSAAMPEGPAERR